MAVSGNVAPHIGIIERLRLAALDSYAIVDTAPEPAFDALVARAAARFRAPMSLISLVDADRQWFKARIGMDVSHTSRDIAFCAHTIETGEPLVVKDALLDRRFATNPLVLSAPHVRFYAGAPLITPLGRVLGTINVIDTKARFLWSPANTAELVALADEVMALLEARRGARVRELALRGMGSRSASSVSMARH